MGKGDKRTRRGKIFKGSFGKTRKTAKALKPKTPKVTAPKIKVAKKTAK
jgi:30S ribosomal protein S31